MDGIDEIKAGGGRRYVVAPKTEVAKARIKTGLSQSHFAALMGVSKRTLEQWEQGWGVVPTDFNILVDKLAIEPPFGVNTFAGD